MKAKLDSEKIYEVFQSHDYLIVPIDKETNRPISDYTLPVLKRCSSATDVFVGVTQNIREEDHTLIGGHSFDLELTQRHSNWGKPNSSVTSGHIKAGAVTKANSGFPYYNIKAADVAFILGSQDDVDFYLIDQNSNSKEPCVVSWKLPKLK